jgi:hypothetical protein
MVNNSTNVNKTYNHLWPQVIKHQKDHDILSYDLGNPLDSHKKVAVYNCAW